MTRKTIAETGAGYGGAEIDRQRQPYYKRLTTMLLLLCGASPFEAGCCCCSCWGRVENAAYGCQVTTTATMTATISDNLSPKCYYAGQ